ncbi:hypothetical protein FGO68_gene9526 [Halteria grandinella]|uniref:Thioredoxin domain-containing protein n=1 Tax=Halteria grandinella TaxID=5974 RepID=A0A8J8NIY6_HALGN|nr:hypothetical protein FGO68_gene9526 [Halteria grandinella]
MATAYDSLWTIGALSIDGHVINQLKDQLSPATKCVMVVNFSTHSPHAEGQFMALNELYDRYEKHGFEILAFPCGQFGKEKESGSNQEIRDYVVGKWGVRFPLFHKVKVNGAETDEVFKYLRAKTPSFVDKSKTPQLHGGAEIGLKIKDIPGNFCKFLLDSNGQVVDCLPNENDDPRKLEQRIQKFLGLSHH